MHGERYVGHEIDVCGERDEVKAIHEKGRDDPEKNSGRRAERADG
jgi:hypothetical protein